MAILALLLALPGHGSSAAEFLVRATTVPEMKAVFGQVESRIVVPARVRIGGTVRALRASQGDEVREGDAIAVVHEPLLPSQNHVHPAGTTSVVCVTASGRLMFKPPFTAGSGPLLRMVTVYVSVAPGVTGSGESTADTTS